MADQRGIVSAWDTVNERPKGVTPAADFRASLGVIADHEGIVYDPGFVFLRSSTSMNVSFTQFTAVIKSPLGGWLCPTIAAGAVTLPVGHASYGRWCTFWVRQWDYQTDASHPDSEVETGFLQGTPSASPVKPTVPAGAIGVFSVLVPKGASSAADVPAANIEHAPWVTPRGGVIPDAAGYPTYWGGASWVPFTRSSLPFKAMYGAFNGGGTALNAGASKDVNITFPAGKFTEPPVILCQGMSSSTNISALNVTKTGFTANVWNVWTGGDAFAGFYYVAIQF